MRGRIAEGCTRAGRTADALLDLRNVKNPFMPERVPRWSPFGKLAPAGQRSRGVPACFGGECDPAQGFQ